MRKKETGKQRSRWVQGALCRLPVERAEVRSPSRFPPFSRPSWPPPASSAPSARFSVALGDPRILRPFGPFFHTSTLPSRRNHRVRRHVSTAPFSTRDAPVRLLFHGVAHFPRLFHAENATAEAPSDRKPHVAVFHSVRSLSFSLALAAFPFRSLSLSLSLAMRDLRRLGKT